MLGCHRPSRPSRDVTAARRREGGEGQAPTGHHCGGPAFRGVGGGGRGPVFEVQCRERPRLSEGNAGCPFLLLLAEDLVSPWSAYMLSLFLTPHTHTPHHYILYSGLRC